MEEISGTFDVFHNIQNDVLAFILAFFILVLALIYFFKAEVKGWLKSRQLKTKKISELKYHDVFSTLKRVVKIVEDIELKTEHNEITRTDIVKTKVMHVLIRHKCIEVEKALTEFLARETIETYQPNQLKQEVEMMLSNLVTNYNKDAISELITLGIKKEDATYSVEQYEKFRTPLVNGFIERLESIAMNNDYQTNYQKVNTILEVVALSLYLIPKDVEDVFKLINGRFLKYNEKALNW